MSTYDTSVDPTWNLFPYPQGGAVTAIAVRAMRDALGRPDQVPRTVHTTFVAPVTDGPVSIEVEVLRSGRTMSQVRAEVRDPDRDRGHLTTCVFGGPRDGFDFVDLQPPEHLRPPDDCASFRDPLALDLPPGTEVAPFWAQRVECRPLRGHLPWDDYEPDRAEQVRWYRLDDAPLLDDGRLDPTALIVLADIMNGAIEEKIGPTDRRWFPPSVDLTVHLLRDCTAGWVLAHNRARFAGDGYASTETALWDCGPLGVDPPQLVAYATQLCLFTFASGDRGSLPLTLSGKMGA
jgi:acyl-CoA thioesterase